MESELAYVTMVGDVVHPGNLNIIAEACKLGEVMVGLLTDRAIVSREHPPYLTYEQREVIIRNIKGVSKVVPQDDWCGEENLRRYKPRYVVHGDDWVSNSLSPVRTRTVDILKEWGGEVVDVPYTHGINSSVISTARREFGTTPELRLMALRRLVEAKPLIRIMEVHSGISGLIVEHAEIEKEDGLHYFDGMWSSSLTDSTSKGKPDIEAVDLTTRMQDLANILECTTKPLIYDGDTGGRPEHFVFTVRTLERNGISAVIIEDKMGLKRNSLFGTDVEQTLAPVEDFCEKIRAGKNAQVTKEFMIIARLESLIAGHSVDEALERARAYIGAGADGIMIHSKEKSGMDIKEFCTRFRKEYPKVPIVLVPTTYNQFKERELQEWGANIIIYANHMLRASYPAMVKVANCILENERSLEANEMCMPIKEILTLIPDLRRSHGGGISVPCAARGHRRRVLHRRPGFPAEAVLRVPEGQRPRREEHHRGQRGLRRGPRRGVPPGHRQGPAGLHAELRHGQRDEPAAVTGRRGRLPHPHGSPHRMARGARGPRRAPARQAGEGHMHAAGDHGHPVLGHFRG